MKYLRKSIFCLLCCSLSATLTAQTSRIDSLEQALTFAKENSLEKGNLLIDISQLYRVADTAKSRSYIMEALSLAQKVGLKKIEARAYCALGNYHLVVGQFYSAYVNYKKAEKVCIAINDKNYLINVYYNMMLVFVDIDDKENTFLYADKLLEIASEWYDLTTLTPINNSTNKIEVFGVYNKLSLIFGAQFHKGRMLYKDNEAQEALNYYLDMFNKTIRLDTKYYQQNIAYTCGYFYNKLNQPHEALKYLHWARKDSEKEINNEISIDLSETYAYLAESHILLNQLDSAEYYLKKSREVPLLVDFMKAKLYQINSTIDSKKGNYRRALENFRKFHLLSDSLTQAGKTAEITRLKNWNELEQKDNDNEILQLEKQKQHKLILILTSSLVMILALFFLSAFLFSKTIRKNRELKELHIVKDKLFSVVAHDLRSPMGALMSVLKLANRNMLDADMQVQLLKDISSRVDDTYGLIDNMLCWAKSQMQGIVPSPAYFDVQEASLSVTDNLQNIAAGKNINLNNRIEPQQVYADSDMFVVVVRNLVMNAIKYTSAKGEIILSSELSDDKLVILVKDTGIGMTQEVQEKLFNLSETKSIRGTNNEGGTGLGLVLCADFVKANGGSIWFTSVQGEGSTFFFSVPKFQIPLLKNQAEYRHSLRRNRMQKISAVQPHDVARNA